MSEKKIIISQKKYRGSSSVVSVRLPDELLRQLDDIAKQSGRTRNEIIQICLIQSVDCFEIVE